MFRRRFPRQRTPAEFLEAALAARPPREHPDVKTVRQLKEEQMTTTTEVPITIVCPDWCTRSAQDHAGELWDYEANCIHHSRETEVPDLAGWHSGMEEPKFHDPASVRMSSMTQPGGSESRPPVFYINDREYSVSQALALIDVIGEQIAAYRDAGGVA